MKFAIVAFITTFCLATLATETSGKIRTSYESIVLNNVKCAFKEVLKIKEVAEQFKEDIQNCRGEVDERVKNLLQVIDEIIKLINEITEIYEKDCKGGEHIGVICKSKMSVKTIQLMGEVTKASNIILDISKVPGDVNECVLNAIRRIGKYLSEFLTNIKACTTEGF